VAKKTRPLTTMSHSGATPLFSCLHYAKLLTDLQNSVTSWTRQ